MELKISDQEAVRRKALEELKKIGIASFPAEEYPRTHFSQDILVQADIFIESQVTVRLAGRLMSKRIMGKAAFAEILDSQGRMQIYLNRDVLCPEEDKTLYNTVFKNLIDIGDILGFEGYIFKTKTGQVSLHVHAFTLLSKSLKVLPIVKTDAEGVAYDAFVDKELRYRKRYVDLVVNPEVKEVFIKRNKIIQGMRSYFNQAGYMEVETPILQPICGGALARPFVTHHHALDIPLYLRIANELYLKRLIVGGFDGVYEFAKDFRNEGMDRTHNPEFTMLELYVAYKDYYWMMDYTEDLFRSILREVNGSLFLNLQGKEVDFSKPFRRIPLLDLIAEKTGFDLHGLDKKALRDVCKKLKIEVPDVFGEGKIIDKIFSEFCEKDLIDPTFVIDHPLSMSPLTKSHRNKEGLTERFELMINAQEIANAYSELNDPIDQLNRFKDQLKLAQEGDKEAMGTIDEDFIEALSYGMPPTAGIGIGIDRLTMLLTGETSIQDVLFFPQMKPKN